MARVLHLDADKAIRDIVSSTLTKIGHSVVSFTHTQDAEQVVGDFDLIICDATIDSHFDGLLFALACKEIGKTVLILAEQHKFSRIPFLSKSVAQNETALIAKVRSLLRSSHSTTHP